MTKSQIEYILSLGKLQNFGLAAQACFISQSTLSAMVAKFEEQSGVEIFNRKTRPITITPQGEKVLKSLKSIYREFQLLDEKINEINGFELGELSIACIPTVAPYLYPLILNTISTTFPKVNFAIHELTTENAVDEIIHGNIDIGIVSIPLEHKELTEYPLYDEDFLIYDCGSKSKSKKYTVSDIDTDRLWLLEEGHCLRNQVGKICDLRQKKKFNSNLTYSCGSIFTLIEMVKMNQGVTLLPRLSLVNNNQLDKQQIYKISKPVPSRKIGLITHRNFVKKRILSSLTAIINEAVKIHLKSSVKDSISYKPF
jgi:LysR family hydrogen peroxide-inducible transcriptional activator